MYLVAILAVFMAYLSTNSAAEVCTHIYMSSLSIYLTLKMSILCIIQCLHCTYALFASDPSFTLCLLCSYLLGLTSVYRFPRLPGHIDYNWAQSMPRRKGKAVLCVLPKHLSFEWCL